jgi:hypothetical protein
VWLYSLGWPQAPSLLALHLPSAGIRCAPPGVLSFKTFLKMESHVDFCHPHLFLLSSANRANLEKIDNCWKPGVVLGREMDLSPLAWTE